MLSSSSSAHATRQTVLQHHILSRRMCNLGGCRLGRRAWHQCSLCLRKESQASFYSLFRMCQSEFTQRNSLQCSSQHTMYCKEQYNMYGKWWFLPAMKAVNLLTCYRLPHGPIKVGCGDSHRQGANFCISHPRHTQSSYPKLSHWLHQSTPDPLLASVCQASPVGLAG